MNKILQDLSFQKILFPIKQLNKIAKNLSKLKMFVLKTKVILLVKTKLQATLMYKMSKNKLKIRKKKSIQMIQ